ncbi:MAG: hypothetical protein ACYC4H_14900 [Desulfocucumaceae bacterium]
MKTIYQGATCEACGQKRTQRNCRPCMTRDGKPGFKPRDGVRVQESEGCTFDAKGRAIATKFIKVEPEEDNFELEDEEGY